jgi:hypothetical protein
MLMVYWNLVGKPFQYYDVVGVVVKHVKDGGQDELALHALFSTSPFVFCDTFVHIIQLSTG